MLERINSRVRKIREIDNGNLFISTLLCIVLVGASRWFSSGFWHGEMKRRSTLLIVNN